MEASQWVLNQCKFAKTKDSLPQVKLGKITTTIIGAGTGTKSHPDASTQVRSKNFRELLEYEYEKGIRLFDCADMYRSHKIVGEVLSQYPRESYQLVSKIYFDKQYLSDEEMQDVNLCIDRFLKELNTDYIDVIQLHAMEDPKWPSKMKKHMQNLSKQLKAGKIKSHGVSCHSLEALKAAASSEWVDIIHARINPFGYKMDADVETVFNVIEKAHQNTKGIIGMKIVGEGKCSESQLASSIGFSLKSGIVDCLIAGFENKQQVDSFLDIVGLKTSSGFFGTKL